MTDLNSSGLVKIIPIFEDNYIFLLPQTDSEFIVIDPGETTSLETYIKSLGVTDPKLNILITHHHPDHIGGVKSLAKKYQCQIWAPIYSREKIPEAHHFLRGNESFTLGSYTFKVQHLPGHTLDHLVYFEETNKYLFVGDVLFRFGCGKLFEGDFQTAYNSLQAIKNYPKETQIFCTHEYTQKNILFAFHKAQEEKDQNWLSRLQEENKKIMALRKKDEPTIPFVLENELINNPFLRVKNAEDFKRIRLERNLF